MLYWNILDYLFVAVHSSLILFNLLGWIWPRTRVAHFICVLLTGGSWFVLGLFYGMGYCPLTDWHFNVLHHLGEHNLPSSYIKYLVERLLGITVSAQWVDAATLIGYLLVLILSIYFIFVKDIRNKKNSQ